MNKSLDDILKPFNDRKESAAARYREAEAKLDKYMKETMIHVETMSKAVDGIEKITNEIIFEIQSVRPSDRTDLEQWILDKLTGDSE